MTDGHDPPQPTRRMPPPRPIIGITTQTLHAIDGIPAALPESWVMNQRYFLAATSSVGCRG